MLQSSQSISKHDSVLTIESDNALVNLSRWRASAYVISFHCIMYEGSSHLVQLQLSWQSKSFETKDGMNEPLQASRSEAQELTGT